MLYTSLLFLDTSSGNMYTWKYYEIFFPVLFSEALMCSVIEGSMNPGGARLITFNLFCGRYLLEEIRNIFTT